MKYLFFGVFASFFLQTIHANRSNNCDKQLAELREAALNFFNGFEQAHDIFYGRVVGIEYLYGALYTALGKFTSKDYGEGLSIDQLRSDMKEFSDVYFFLDAETWDALHRVEQNLFELTEMISCFKIETNLNCQRRSSATTTTTTCETELNKLRCDLAEFLADTVNDFNRGVRNVDVISYTCSFVTKQTRNFYTKNQISCGASCSYSERELRRNIRNYVASFNSEQIAYAHSKLENIDSSCNTLIGAINDWQSQLS